MYTRIEIITPEIAASYLKKNVKNRNIRKRVVTSYARDMKNGDWNQNGQSIGFFENGTLADGQHRLMAVIEAGVPVEFLVVYDIPNGSNIIDVGVKRTTNDIIKLSGVDVSNLDSATVRCLFRFANSSDPTIAVVRDFLIEHHEMVSIATKIVSHGVDSKYTIAKKASCSGAAFCALYSGVDEEVIDRFFVCVNSGAYDSNRGESASTVYRNWLIRNYTGKDNLNRKQALVQACYAINDFEKRINRKLIYTATRTVPFWSKTKEEIIKPYLETY